MYQPRLIDQTLIEYLGGLPAVLIEGAKGVGKTETCRRLANTHYFLEDDIQRQYITGQPDQLLEDNPPILIDEWQLAPSLWTYTRRQIDNGMQPGRILFTGSSIKVHSRIHSGAGRIVRLTLRPFTVEERQMSEQKISIKQLFQQPETVTGQNGLNLGDYLDEIFKSGFPSMRELSDDLRQTQLNSYLRTIIERDFEENGIIIKQPQIILAWLRSFAAAIGTTTRQQKIVETFLAGSEEAPSRQTAQKYREALNLLFIIDEVPAFLGMGKVFKNLAKAPKHFMADPALAMSLLGVSKENLINYKQPEHIGKFNITLIGQLLESLVYQSLVVYTDLHYNASLYHLREQRGKREIDFVLVDGRKMILFEVKADQKIDHKSVEHLNWFEEKAGDEYQITKVVLYTGQYAFTREDGVHVVPIAMLAE